MCVCLLTLFGCQESLDSSYPTEPEETTAIEETTLPTQPVPELYRSIGKQYRDAIFQYGHLEELPYDPGFPVSEPEEFDYEDGLAQIEGYKLIPGIDPNDIDKTIALIEALAELPLAGNTFLSKARAMVDEIVVQLQITVEEAPLAFHTAEIMKASVFSTDLTYLAEDAGNMNVAFRGADDSQLCVFKKSCKGVLLTLDIISVAITVVSGIASAGTTFTIGSAAKEVLKNIVKIGFKTLIKQLVCGRQDHFDCDDCGPALGFTYYYDDCETYGIRPVGNFEWSYSFDYLFDPGQDGAFGNPQFLENLNPRIQYPKGKFSLEQLSDISESILENPFDVKVSVVCDGEVEFPWPLTQPGTADLSTPPIMPFPYDNISITSNAPLAQNAPITGFYNFGTELTFSLTSVVYPMPAEFFTFVGWQTTGGASPSSGSDQFTFTTTFYGTQATTGSASAVFRNNCDNTLEYITYSLVLLP